MTNSNIKGFLIAMVLITLSPLAPNHGIYIVMLMLGVGVGIYSAIMSIPTSFKKEEDLFAHIPVPVPAKEVKVRHEHHHHNYNYTSCEEGREITQRLPDGRVMQMRHVRRWK